MGQCHHKAPSLTRDTLRSLPHSTWRLGNGWQVRCRSTASLDCLLSKWSDSRSALSTDSHTNPLPSLTSGGNDELELNTADLRVDHHLWGDWTFIRTSLFLSLNWCLASEWVSLALTWQWTNSSKLIRERSRVHWRWASCLRPKICLHWSSNQGLPLLRKWMTLAGA